MIPSWIQSGWKYWVFFRQILSTVLIYSTFFKIVLSQPVLPWGFWVSGVKKTDCMGELESSCRSWIAVIWQHKAERKLTVWESWNMRPEPLCLGACCCAAWPNCCVYRQNVRPQRFQALCCISSISYCAYHSKFDNAAACFWEDHNCQLHPSCLINRKICHSNKKKSWVRGEWQEEDIVKLKLLCS